MLQNILVCCLKMLLWVVGELNVFLSLLLSFRVIEGVLLLR